MFLRRARETRLVTAFLLFMLGLVMVPKADIPETVFDEANSPTNEIVVEKAASAWEQRPSVTVFVSRILVQPRQTSARKISQVCPGWLTHSPTFRERFCSFLC